MLQGAGHNDVELYSQYLERLKKFVSVELQNWQLLNSSTENSNNCSFGSSPSFSSANEKLLWRKNMCKRYYETIFLYIQFFPPPRSFYYLRVTVARHFAFSLDSWIFFPRRQHRKIAEFTLNLVSNDLSSPRSLSHSKLPLTCISTLTSWNDQCVKGTTENEGKTIALLNFLVNICFPLYEYSDIDMQLLQLPYIFDELFIIIILMAIDTSLSYLIIFLQIVNERIAQLCLENVCSLYFRDPLLFFYFTIFSLLVLSAVAESFEDYR